MTKFISRILLVSVCFLAFSCGNKSADSAASIAKKWCELNARVERAESDEAKDAAKTARKNYENEMDKKMGDNQTLRDEVGKEIEKCEDASEGK